MYFNQPILLPDFWRLSLFSSKFLEKYNKTLSYDSVSQHPDCISQPTGALPEQYVYVPQHIDVFPGRYEPGSRYFDSLPRSSFPIPLPHDGIFQPIDAFPDLYDYVPQHIDAFP